jgi:hypothetical protein
VASILEDAGSDFLPLVLAYVLANPHLSLTLRRPGGEWSNKTGNPTWSKWRACDPTSAHWYTPDGFERLLAAYIQKDQETGRRRPLREFLTQFDGLSGTSRRSKVLTTVGLSGSALADLLRDGEPDKATITALLRAMQAETKPVKPDRLGIIGETHLRGRIKGDAFKYARAMGVDGKGYPYVVEGAFAWNPDVARRVLFTGANFASSPALSFNLTAWDDIGRFLERYHAGSQEPVTVFLHVTHPRLTFTDLGKTNLSLAPAVASEVQKVIEKITSDWHRQRKSEERNARAELKRRDTLERVRRITIKESVYRHLPAAYARASGDLGARSRQIYYQLRPIVLEETGRDSLDSQYVEQQLIPDFIAEHPEIAAGWTVFYDDRGHLIEPHTRTTIGLGTKNVREYCAGWHAPIIKEFELSEPGVITHGPQGRYSAILFCEKEGFTEIFQAAQLPERYDIALASTKGTSVTACRELFEKLTRLADRLGGIPIFCLHDFDYNGFEITATLYQNTRRYQFEHPPEVIDIGLRLNDVERLKLQPEAWVFEKGGLRENLRNYGATDAEIAFLIRREYQAGEKTRTEGERVELNALTSPQLIELIETSLISRGVKKVVPNQDTLKEVYRKRIVYRRAQEALEEAILKASDEQGEIEVPDNLEEQVREYLQDHPAESWDDAARVIAERSI